MIDAHHHLWNVSAREYQWLAGGQVWASDEEVARLRRSFTLADLGRLAPGASLNGTVVVQTVNQTWETEDLLGLAAGLDPWQDGSAELGALITGVVGWADLTAPSVADALASLRELPGGEVLAGIRHPLITEPDGWLVSEPVLRGLAAMAAAGLCFDVIAPPAQLPSVVTAARQVPSLTFVLEHLGGPPVDGDDGGAWAMAIASLGELPNVACKLSGAHTYPATAAALRPYYETVLAAFGPDRLMFGSDWPVCTLAASYPDVLAAARDLTAGLTPAEREAVFAGTATAVYGL